MDISIALIILFGLLSDWAFRKLHLPGLLGMLIVGVVFGPYFYDIIQPELMSVSADLRNVALIVILLRAGLELRRDTINRVGLTATVMAILPAVAEGVTVALLAPRLLGISPEEGLVLGAILAAVSPAVVVTFMVRFIQEGRGRKKGIPTLMLGASSLNDVFVIVAFGILLGMTGGAHLSLARQLLQIPEAVVLGILVGGAAGFVLYRLFVRHHLRATKMTLVIIAAGILLTWLEAYLRGTVEISGLLGVMTIGFIILEKAEGRAHKISAKLAKVWIFAEILLFVLVGAQVDVGLAVEAGAAGALLILAGLAARSAAGFISLTASGLNVKEKIFCLIAYTPKATVQAAIGAIPYELGVPGGEVILAVAVLSIVITAPLGAIGTELAGRYLLTVDDPPQEK